MRRRWLVRENGPNLLLVFAGWGLGTLPFLGVTGFGDVLVVDDYRDLGDPLRERYAYDRVTVLAYSFGVASAAHWINGHDLRPERLVAVNGTLLPADPDRGIAPDTVEATARGLSCESFGAFCRRAGLRTTPPALEIERARDELRAIAKRGTAPRIGFDKIWIADRDRIIPTSAQEAAWQDQSARTCNFVGGHIPFVPGQTWQGWLS